jgi:hypothetical protein
VIPLVAESPEATRGASSSRGRLEEVTIIDAKTIVYSLWSLVSSFVMGYFV